MALSTGPGENQEESVLSIFMEENLGELTKEQIDLIINFNPDNYYDKVSAMTYLFTGFRSLTSKQNQILFNHEKLSELQNLLKEQNQIFVNSIRDIVGTEGIYIDEPGKVDGLLNLMEDASKK